MASGDTGKCYEDFFHGMQGLLWFFCSANINTIAARNNVIHDITISLYLYFINSFW